MSNSDDNTQTIGQSDKTENPQEGVGNVERPIQPTGFQAETPTPASKPSKLLDGFLQDIFTKPQLLRRTRVLKDFVNFRLFTVGEGEKLGLDKQIQMFIALHEHDILELNLLRQEGNWLVSLGEPFYSQFNKSNFLALFEQLEKEVASAKHVIMYLPVELPEANQLELGKWLKENIGPDTTFETHFDPNLIGGCALSYNGVYRDYSLQARISENKDAILENLRSFKKT